MVLVFIVHCLLMGSGVLAFLQDSCTPPECDVEPSGYLYAVRCVGGTFTAFPIIRNCGVNISVLSLENTLISVLPEASIPAGLTTITFIHNPLKNIHVGAFDYCARTLEELTFNASLDGEIPNALKKFVHLRLLDISNEQITNWNLPVLQKIGSTVKEVRLTNLGLSSWPTWLNYFTAITSLAVDGNNVTCIPDEWLNAVGAQLTELNLRSSLLSRLPEAMSNLTALTFLDLSYNLITHVTNIPPHITNLHLEGNKIVEIADASFSLMPYLRYLVLDGNPMTTVGAHAFNNTPAVDTLSMTGTNLTRVPTALSELSDLSILDMSNSVNLVCTCAESGLQTFFEGQRSYYITGQCGSIDIFTFFTTLAKDCPTSVF